MTQTFEALTYETRDRKAYITLSRPERLNAINAAMAREIPAAVTAAVLGGAHIVRVHRVAEMVQVVRVADAVRDHTPGR